MDLQAVLKVSMRWLHITSVVALIGGFLYARFAVWPALDALRESDRVAFVETMVTRIRAILYTVMVAALGSGLYNYLTKPFYPPHYHMIIGVKFLFVMHVFAVAILYTLPNADLAKRRRWLTGLVISGLVIIAISTDLRWISTVPTSVVPQL